VRPAARAGQRPVQEGGPRNRLRRIPEYQAQSRIDAKKDRFGYLVIRTLDALTRTR